jgi:hypothetical protein
MSHQIHVARSDEVIWVSLEGRNIHDLPVRSQMLNNIWDVIDLSTHQLHR